MHSFLAVLSAPRPQLSLRGVSGQGAQRMYPHHRSVPRVVCTVSKSAKTMEQQFYKVCYSVTQKLFTVPLDPQ